MNPLRAHTQYIQAQEAARKGGNETMVMTGYNRMLMQLSEHQRRLKGVQSNERKAELKREFLPLYAPWVAGLLASDSPGQDDVAMFIMIWRIDAGDYTGALEIARHALRHRWVLPQRFNRTTGTAIAEEFSDVAMKAFTAGEPFSAAILTQVLDLVEDQDMPDQSRARLCKAMGYALRANDQAVAALSQLKRALQLDSGCGVKTDIRQLETLLRKTVTG